MENKNYVFRVSALYDMNIDKDEEIIQEIYATEQLAQARCKQLIASYKAGFNDAQPYADLWEEDECKLYAYMDSEWNVDISYVKEEIRICLEHGNAENEPIQSTTLTFDIYEGKDGLTWFVEKYKEVESGKSLYRYGYGSTDNWTTVCEGLTERPNLKKMKLVK
jgi:hypothetical protein